MAKRNAQGGGSIRQRLDGRWEARYSAGRNPATCKQVQRSLYGDTQKEVLQKLNQVLNDLEQGTYIEPSNMTVKAWLKIWIKEYTGNVKETTRKKYEQVCDDRIIPAIGTVKLSALKPHVIQSFYNKALQGAKGRSPLSPKSVKNMHGILNKALNQALMLGYMKNNPASVVTLPRVERTEIKPLDNAQISAFLKALSGHRFETLYTVTLFTGLRQGEIMGLTWDNVDLMQGTITVKQQLQRFEGVYRLVSVKNDKLRIVTPAPSIIAHIVAYKAKQAQAQLTAGTAWSNPMNLIFTDEIGGHMIRETVYRHFKAIIKELGLDDTRFHDLRHTYAVASIQAGDDIKTVQENLGHHTAAFTLDTYAHVTEDMKRASADRMEKFIEGLEKA